MKMKKVLIVCGIAIIGYSSKAQTGKVVVYIPKTNTCYEAGAISSAVNRTTLTLKISNAFAVEPTAALVKSASSCTKGEFRSDDTHGGTHNVECDQTVAQTCFCTGVK
jgi:hypothetical protein